MLNVTLIGDSIRAGYQPMVTELLAGRADVWGPEQNGGDSANVRAHLEQWAAERPADVIHVNCGLHDIKREFGARVNQVPLDRYEENVRWILTTLQAMDGVRVIWATTTPVNYQWHHDNKPMDRFEEDVAAYNEKAAAVARSLGVEIDDLSAVIVAAGPNNVLLADGVHFKPEGSRLLAEQVVRAIGL